MSTHSQSQPMNGSHITEAKIADKPGTFVFTHEGLVNNPVVSRGELAKVLDTFVERKLKEHRATELLAQLKELEALNMKVTIEYIPTAAQRHVEEVQAAKEEGIAIGESRFMRKVEKIAPAAIAIASYTALIGGAFIYGKGVRRGAKDLKTELGVMGVVKAARWYFSK